MDPSSVEEAKSQVRYKTIRILIAVSLWLLTVFLSGCSDRAEIERLAHVVVLGLDRVDDQFIKVTFQIANPQVGSTDRSQAEKEPSSDTITITATDIVNAKELSKTIIPRRMSFTHLQTIIISEELARTDQLHEMIAGLIRQPEMRREMNLIISREPAQRFIRKNKPRLETRPHKYYEFMIDQWEESGLVPISTINDYLKALSGELFLAIYATTEKVEAPLYEYEDKYKAGEVPAEESDPVQIIGSAVIKQGKMIGVLSGEETRYSLMLRPDDWDRTQVISFPDPIDKGQRVTVHLLRKGAPRVQLDLSGKAPKIDVTVRMDMQILSIQSMIDYAGNQQNIDKLKRFIEDVLEQGTMNFIRKTQEEYRGEPFLWHLEARKKFWTWEEYNRYDWFSQYPRAEVKVKYDIDVQSFGKQFQPPKINEERMR